VDGRHPKIDTFLIRPRFWKKVAQHGRIIEDALQFQHRFCLMKQNTHYLPECVVPLLRSESLSGKCAKLHTVAASNNRDHKITLVITISKYYQLFTSFTSIIRDHSPRSLHWDHSICAYSRHICMGVILRVHPVRGESHIQCNANWEVATPLWALSCL